MSSHNYITHHVCLPAFHFLCFSFTFTPHKWCSCDCLFNDVLSHSTNGKCHPHLSNTITPSLLPFPTTDVPCGKCHHSKCQTHRHSHGEGYSADAYTQGQNRCVAGLCGDFMKGNGTLTQCFKQQLEQKKHCPHNGEQQEEAINKRKDKGVTYNGVSFTPKWIDSTHKPLCY